MENLLSKNPDINVVYTINEPAAYGAYEALKAAGSDRRTCIVVSVDGGCAGVDAVKDGIIGATSQQYPVKMAELGVAGDRRPRRRRARRPRPPRASTSTTPASRS